MQEACHRMLSYTAGKDFEVFSQDLLLQDGVIRNLEVLGEACSQLMQVLPDATLRFPGIAFRTIYSTRNRLIHGYHTLEIQPIWSIVQNDIPPLNKKLETILSLWSDDLEV